MWRREEWEEEKEEERRKEGRKEGRGRKDIAMKIVDTTAPQKNYTQHVAKTIGNNTVFENAAGARAGSRRRRRRLKAPGCSAGWRIASTISELQALQLVGEKAGKNT